MRINDYTCTNVNDELTNDFTIRNNELQMQ